MPLLHELGWHFSFHTNEQQAQLLPFNTIFLLTFSPIVAIILLSNQDTQGATQCQYYPSPLRYWSSRLYRFSLLLLFNSQLTGLFMEFHVSDDVCHEGLEVMRKAQEKECSCKYHKRKPEPQKEIGKISRIRIYMLTVPLSVNILIISITLLLFLIIF